MSERRPSAVAWACVLTWAASAFTALGLVASAVVLAVRPDPLLDEVHRTNPELRSQGVSDDLLIAVTYGMIAVLLVWCIGAAAAAVLTYRRVGWGRIVLIVSACVCAVLCLLGCAVGALLLLVPLAASATTAGLLLRPDTGPWFEQVRRAGPRP